VLGEFLARRYPDGQHAQHGAEIAMKAYARLCGEATPGDDRKFEAARMTAMADFITHHLAEKPRRRRGVDDANPHRDGQEGHNQRPSIA